MPFTAFWIWLEETPFAQEIGATWWFPLLESLHVLSVAVLVGAILMVDLRLIGVAALRYPASRLIGELTGWSWAGLSVALLTGAGLFSVRAATYVEHPPFLIKLALLLLCGLNMALFQLRTIRGIEAWDAAASPPLSARFAGAASLALWAGVVLAGRWIGHTI